MSIVKLSNNGVKNATAFGSISSLGSMTFIKKITISSPVSSVQFVHGSNGVVLDDTYKEYYFTFNNLHPNSNTEPDIAMNFSTDGGSNYNVTKTTTSFYAYHTESDSTSALAYDAPSDLAQSTAYQLLICGNVGDDADQALAGSMTLFNPSSTVFVKHFISRINTHATTPYSMDNYIAGYGNTTSAVNAINFLFDEGNIDSGQIKLYGLAN